MNTSTICTALSQAVKLAAWERNILDGFIQKTENTIAELTALSSQGWNGDGNQRASGRLNGGTQGTDDRPHSSQRRRVRGIYDKIREIVSRNLFHPMTTKELRTICRENVPEMCNQDVHNVLSLGVKNGLWQRLEVGIYAPIQSGDGAQTPTLRSHNLSATRT